MHAFPFGYNPVGYVKFPSERQPLALFGLAPVDPGGDARAVERLAAAIGVQVVADDGQGDAGAACVVRGDGYRASFASSSITG